MQKNFWNTIAFLIVFSPILIAIVGVLIDEIADAIGLTHESLIFDSGGGAGVFPFLLVFTIPVGFVVGLLGNYFSKNLSDEQRTSSKKSSIERLRLLILIVIGFILLFWH